MKRTPGFTGKILSITAIFLAFTAPAMAAKKDCAMTPMTSVDLMIGEGGAAILPVTLNGKRAGLTLRLEAIASLIAPSSADEWSLPRRKAPRDIQFGKQKVKQMAEYQELAVGDLKYAKGLFLIAPAPMSTPMVEGVEVIGWLSGSAFRGVDFELDLAHRKFKVFSQDHCPGKVVYWSDRYSSAPLFHGKSGAFFFPMELEGKKVFAAISNTQPVTTIGTDVTRAFFGFDKSSPGVEAAHEADGALYHYRAMQLTAPGLTVTNARIRLVDPNKNCPLDTDRHQARYLCAGGYPMSLGIDVLQQLRLYFATKEGKLYFTAADAGVAGPTVHISPQ